MDYHLWKVMLSPHTFQSKRGFHQQVLKESPICKVLCVNEFVGMVKTVMCEDLFVSKHYMGLIKIGQEIQSST